MGAGNSALEGVPLFVGQPAADSRVLTGLDGPCQTGGNDLAATADGLCLFDLEKRRTGVPNREEQFGVLAYAGSAVAPRHQNQAP
jgi:hypothetical protein